MRGAFQRERGRLLPLPADALRDTSSAARCSSRRGAMPRALQFAYCVSPGLMLCFFSFAATDAARDAPPLSSALPRLYACFAAFSAFSREIIAFTCLPAGAFDAAAEVSPTPDAVISPRLPRCRRLPPRRCRLILITRWRRGVLFQCRLIAI